LYWLEPGKNTFGTSDQVQIKFPTNSITANAGWFEYNGGKTVILHTNNETNVLVNGVAKKDAVVFSIDSTKPIVCAYGTLRWTIIKRDDKIGIRLRDLNSSLVKEFKGIERFAVDSTLKVKAYLQKPVQPASVFITNVLRQTNAEKSPGKLIFTLNNQQYSLDALEEGNQLFIIFGDATSGKETYATGRFLSAAFPDASGYTVLDFNKAYNPPCAFTSYATCPLPPKQNVLPIAITAGEKNYHYSSK
jgi:uncharacterized protein (DUF1684 family)